MKLKIGDFFINMTGAPGTIYGALLDDISIEKELGVRSIANFTVWHTDPSIRYQKGLPYEIYSVDDDLLIAGSIEKVKWTRANDGTVTHQIDGIGYIYLADKRLAIKSYTNTLAGDIARDFYASYLTAEGVALGEIHDGPEITEAIFNYVGLSRSLDRLADSIGFYWEIDNQKRFNFVARATREAPWELTYLNVNGTPEVEHGNLKYRNTQYILDAKNITSPQIATRQGDGNNRAFLVDYPIAKKPSIEVKLGANPFVAVDGGDIGIRGVDSGKKWYWNKNDKVISQDENEAELTSSDYVRITYQGFEEIVVKVSDFDAISAMQTVEGFGSGIVEEVARRSDLGTLEAALEAGSEELDKNRAIGDRITFPTVRPGLEPGQMLTVNLPRYDLNEPMLIEKVVITGGPLVWYEVTASRGTVYESWVKMFTRAFYNNEPLVIRENISEKEFLRLVIDFSKTWEEEDSPNIFVSVAPSIDLALGFQPEISYNNRVKYVEAFDSEGVSLGRKYLTSQNGQTGDTINTRFFISDTEFNGDIAELAWYGGIEAGAESGSGIEIDRQAYVHTKTTLEALIINRQDLKGW